MVDVRAFVDHRNAEPVIYREPWEPEWPRVAFNGEAGFYLYGINADLEVPNLFLPYPRALGYDYTGADQPYLLEVWVEKSTVNDVLEPVCRQFGINLVVSAGFQSISNAVALIERARAAHKPARVFYISDFDPAGCEMPQSVARQVEYWLSSQSNAAGAGVALTPVALTREQISAYELPRVPIKESDRRRANFEALHGEGAVELDALEALHPGPWPNCYGLPYSRTGTETCGELR